METERERAFNSYKPCYFIEQFVKAISRCLGMDSATEREYGEGTRTTISQSLRKPSKPPVTKGPGGQVNVCAS